VQQKKEKEKEEETEGDGEVAGKSMCVSHRRDFLEMDDEVYVVWGGGGDERGRKRTKGRNGEEDRKYRKVWLCQYHGIFEIERVRVLTFLRFLVLIQYHVLSTLIRRLRREKR
jgi:hypothetical protein